MINIEADKIGKKFGKLFLFKNINFSLTSGDSFYITGPNGSGKSTLLQIIAGIQKPTSGSVIYKSDGSIVDNEKFKNYFGFTGPQINPYDMLSSIENLEFVSTGTPDKNRITEYLEKFDLLKHRTKAVKYYSSGMKQRLRLIHALINDPEVIMLDEPCSNLDTKGRDILYGILDTIKKDRVIIIATNENEDINICSKGISLEQ